MNRFLFSQTYTFKEIGGHRKRHFLEMTENTGDKATFRFREDKKLPPVSGYIVMDGDTETIAFRYKEKLYTLRADNCFSKGYRFTGSGSLDKELDKMRDAYLMTYMNRDEIEKSGHIQCAGCGRKMQPSDITEYIDDGKTAVCPYCGTDALLGDGAGQTLTDFRIRAVHNHYFTERKNPLIQIQTHFIDEPRPSIMCPLKLWIGLDSTQDKRKVEAGFYGAHETLEKFREFVDSFDNPDTRILMQAVDFICHDIEGQEAIDAIEAAFLKLLIGKDKAVDIPYHGERDIDFDVMQVYPKKIINFTLTKDGRLIDHKPSDL